MDIELADAEPRIKCPYEDCDGILVKNTSEYSKPDRYTCNGHDGHFIHVPPEELKKALEKKAKQDVEIVENKAIHVVKTEGEQCVFG